MLATWPEEDSFRIQSTETPLPIQGDAQSSQNTAQHYRVSSSCTSNQTRPRRRYLLQNTNPTSMLVKIHLHYCIVRVSHALQTYPFGGT